jgi:hypothetical protein
LTRSASHTPRHIGDNRYFQQSATRIKNYVELWHKEFYHSSTNEESTNEEIEEEIWNEGVGRDYRIVQGLIKYFLTFQPCQLRVPDGILEIYI